MVMIVMVIVVMIVVVTMAVVVMVRGKRALRAILVLIIHRGGQQYHADRRDHGQRHQRFLDHTAINLVNCASHDKPDVAATAGPPLSPRTP
jgi:hypothetical protein